VTRGADRLGEWFDAGTLIRPCAEHASFVDLIRALARLVGFAELPTSDNVGAISAEIGPADHYVLVLIDGMGTRILDKLPEDSFLRRNLRRELHAVFPATTAAALTALTTGHWPATHGVPGWWVYLPEPALTVTPLRFTERFQGTPLQELGIPASAVFPVSGFWDRIDRPSLTVVPEPYIGSVFSKYASCGTPTKGYVEIDDAFREVARRSRAAQGPTFTYLYIPHVDETAHKQGVAHQDMERLLAYLDAQLTRLAGDLPPDTRVVVTADHGLIDTPEDRRLIVDEGDELLSYLACAPSLEATVPAFHVLPGRDRAFAKAFEDRLGDYFALVSAQEIDDMRLLGPEPLSAIARQRIGTFLGFSDRSTALYYQPRRSPVHTHIGVHASLSPDEMLIPLIIS